MQKAPVELLLAPALSLLPEEWSSYYSLFYGLEKTRLVQAVHRSRPDVLPVLLDNDKGALLEERDRLGGLFGMGFLRDPLQYGWEKDLPGPARLIVAGYALSAVGNDDKLYLLQEFRRLLPAGGMLLWLDLFLPPVLSYLEPYRAFLAGLENGSPGSKLEAEALAAVECGAVTSPCLLQSGFELLQEAGYAVVELTAKLGHHCSIAAFK